MTRAITLFLCTALSTADPAAAQSDQATSARLDALFGAHEPYRAFLAALKESVSEGDEAAVAAMVAYPLETTLAGERVTLASEDDFMQRYEQLLTPAVVAAVEKQTYATLFANAEGAMIGDGEVWFSGVCGDATCAEASVRIIAVNPPDGDGS